MHAGRVILDCRAAVSLEHHWICLPPQKKAFWRSALSHIASCSSREGVCETLNTCSLSPGERGVLSQYPGSNPDSVLAIGEVPNPLQVICSVASSQRWLTCQGFRFGRGGPPPPRASLTIFATTQLGVTVTSALAPSSFEPEFSFF